MATTQPYFTVKKLRISKTSANGVDITRQLENVDQIIIPHTSAVGNTPSSTLTYVINGRQELTDSYIFDVSVGGNNISGSDETGASTIFEPYISQNFERSEYNVLLNNASAIANAANVQKVDYSTNPNIPVNLTAIRGNIAERAEVQELLYTSPGLVSGRYGGQQLTGQEVNKYSAGDKSYGKTPVIESTTPYFCIFDYISGFSPEHNQANAIVIAYVVDEEGNIFTPDSPIALPTIQQAFPAYSEFEVSIQSSAIGGSEATLLGAHTVLRPASRLEPILFSYTAATYLNPVFNLSNKLAFETDPNLATYDAKASGVNQTITNPIVGQRVTLTATSETKDDKSYYNTTTSTYTFGEDTEQPVKFAGTFTFDGDGQPSPYGSTPGEADIKFIKSSDGSFGASTISVLGSKRIIYQDFQTETVNFSTPYAYGKQGEAVRMVVDFVTQTTELNFDLKIFNAVSLESGSSYVSASNEGYFFATGSNSNYTVLTASLDLSGKYDKYFTGVSGAASQGFNAVNLRFNILPGDEIKFNNDERKAFLITDVETPSENTVGRLYLRLDKPMTASSNKDFFAIRRYVDTSNMILMNIDKVAGTQNTGILYPKYPSPRLKANYENIISNLKNKGIL